jgi:4-oxalocrotonate tautomerase
MPLVEITLRTGKSQDYIRAVADALHAALVAQISIPADDRFQIIHQVDDTTIIAHPSYGGVNRSSDLIIIKVTLSAGRSVDIKKNLFADIVSRLGKAADVRPDDVLICLIEVAKENWSFGNGKANYA